MRQVTTLIEDVPITGLQGLISISLHPKPLRLAVAFLQKVCMVHKRFENFSVHSFQKSYIWHIVYPN